MINAEIAKMRRQIKKRRWKLAENLFWRGAFLEKQFKKIRSMGDEATLYRWLDTIYVVVRHAPGVEPTLEEKLAGFRKFVIDSECRDEFLVRARREFYDLPPVYFQQKERER